MLLGLFHPTTEWTVIIALLQQKKKLRRRMPPACIILFQVKLLGPFLYKHMLLASWLSRAAPFYDAVTAKMVGPRGICEGCLESSYSSFELRK